VRSSSYCDEMAVGSELRRARRNSTGSLYLKGVSLKYLLLIGFLIIPCLGVAETRTEQLKCQQLHKSKHPYVAKSLGVAGDTAPLVMCTVGTTKIWSSPNITKQVIETGGNLIIINGDAIHVSDADQHVLTVTSRNDTFNSVSYSCVDSSCQYVTDYNSDGEIDFRVSKDRNGLVELKVDGIWYVKTSSAPDLRVQYGNIEKAVLLTGAGFTFVR